MKTVFLTKKELTEARDWCLDNAVTEEDVSHVNEADDSEIIRLVKRNYPGGIEQFKKDGNL